MKKSLFILFVLFMGLNTYGQRRRDIGNIPQGNREPTQKEIEKREREVAERKTEYLNNFLTTLEADEFQKVIIKQTLDTYFDKKLVILKTNFNHSIDRKEAIKILDDNHFKELTELISEDDMSKIKELIAGKFDEKEVLRNKKKNRRKKGKG